MPTKFTIEHTCPHCHELFDVAYKRIFTRLDGEYTLPVSSPSCPACGNTDTQSSEDL